MSGASEDLLRAVYGLRKAAEAEFQGNAYYKVANEIDGLLEQLGWGAGIPPGKGAAYGFASMLADVRKEARASLFANDYYRIAHKLELLSSFLAPSAKAPQSEPKSEAPVAQAVAAASANPPLHDFTSSRQSFDDLAAASKARAGGVTKSFGMALGHHAEVPHREPERISADGELERRSSEPCSMAELAPVIVEPVAAAAVSAEAAAMSHAEGAARHLGSPSAEAGDGAVEGTASATAAEAHARAAPELSALEHDRAADAAGQKVESPPAERRLESLSSEAFSQGVEALEPASVPGEIAARPGAEQAPLHLGSPSAQGEAREEVRLNEIAPKEAAGEAPAVEASTLSGQPQAAPAPEKIEAKVAGEPKGKRPKTLFRLWLDLAFGRKR